MAGFVPVESKLRAPTHRADLVLRGELVDRLRESAAPVVLITGPCGYGKTVLAEQWAGEDERSFAWVSLDTTDNDPHVLVTYVMLALHRIERFDADVIAALGSADANRAVDVVLPVFGRLLQHRRPFVLVLDNAETVTSPDALAVVTTVADHLPPGARLVLSSRTVPPLDWGRLRAGGRLLEIRTDELRLSRAEARALVESVGITPEPELVETLLTKTEGWAAGMYLATLPLAGRESPASVVATLSGSESAIAQYLRDQLLARLPPGDQTFLVRTSILTTLSGPTCDAVLMASRSGEQLRRLERAGVLMVPLDGASRRYRLHPMLGDALRAELLRCEPQMVKVLHSRASLWLEEHGDVDEAIAHAIAAGSAERAGRLVWSRAPACLADGNIQKIEGWLEAFTPREIAAHAKLGLAAAVCAVQRGCHADVWLASAEQGSYEAGRPGESASAAGGAALLRAILARRGALQMGADARLAQRLIEPASGWLCTAGLLSAISEFLTGSAAQAKQDLTEVERRAEALGVHQCRALALTELALVALDENDWDEVERRARRAEALSDAHALHQLAILLPLRCLSALLAARAPGEARAMDAWSAVQECRAAIAAWDRPPAWLAVQSRHLLASAELALGQPSAARLLLSEAQVLLAELPDATFLRDAIDETWRQLGSLPLETSSGPSMLTSAELRVLRLLPTHLSFEEIGRQLFLSRNTVKTQAMATYRKLGVNSRSGAVERAYELGLIPEKA